MLRDALHRLERRGYTRLASGRGSRAPKYRHLLAEALPMSRRRARGAVRADAARRADARGAQAAGRADARASPIWTRCTSTLERLIERELVVRLERRPGQKEERYGQLLERRLSTSLGRPARRRRATPRPRQRHGPPHRARAVGEPNWRSAVRSGRAARQPLRRPGASGWRDWSTRWMNCARCVLGMIASATDAATRRGHPGRARGGARVVPLARACCRWCRATCRR